MSEDEETEIELTGKDVSGIPPEVYAGALAAYDAEAEVPESETDPDDTCAHPVLRNSQWQACAWPNTHTVVFAGLAPQRFCAHHHGEAKPIIG